jgi:hypothetical protein
LAAGSEFFESHRPKMKLVLPILFALIVFGPWTSLNAQSAPQSPPGAGAADVGQQRIDEVLTKPKVTPENFAASYLEHNTQAKVEGIVKDIKSQVGDYKSVKKSTEKNDPPFDDSWQRYTAVFAKGTEDIYIHFDDAGKIDALSFRAPKPGGA